MIHHMNRKFLFNFYYVVCAMLIALSSVNASHAFGKETAKHAFGLNIAEKDSEPLRLALDSVFKAQVSAGTMAGPIEAEWYLGNARMKAIQYSFGATIPALNFLDSGIDVTVQLHNFTGTLHRIEFNKTGTSFCEEIPVNTNGNPIDVQVRLNAEINDQGEVHLIVKSSQVMLNSDNFQVGSPAHCNVLLGFNWLVRWLVPTVAEGYRDVLAAKIASTMAKTLQDISLVYGPYLGMNITLPVRQDPIRPFYARLSIAPQDVRINRSNFSTWFASEIDFDPDMRLSLDAPTPWPTQTSHLAISWDFLNGFLREANTKGLISGDIKPSTSTGALYDSKVWSQVWADIGAVLPDGSMMEFELDGAESLTWESGGAQKVAVLRAKDLRIIVKNRSLLLARLHINLRVNVDVNIVAKNSRKFLANIKSIAVDQINVDKDFGILASSSVNQESLRQLGIKLEQSIAVIPIEARKLIEFTAPSVNIGASVVQIMRAEFHDQGILLPIQLNGKPANRH